MFNSVQAHTERGVDRLVLRFKAICSAYHFDDSLIGATTDNPSVIEYQIVKTVGSNVQVGFSKATDSILML